MASTSAGSWTDYNTNDLRYNNIDNDSVSSILLSYGAFVELYDSDGFNGLFAEYDGATASSNFYETPRCIDLSGHDNKLSSFKLLHKTTGAAMGEWEVVGAGSGSVNLDLTWGITSTHTEVDTAALTTTLATEMKEGIEFESVKVNDSVSSSITTATTDTFTETSGGKFSVPCVGDAKEAVGLW